MIDFSQDHFTLFGLERAFEIDLGRVEQAYRDLQAQVHPDKFAHASEAEKRLSMQWATHVNEAYQTLKQPISRARYLLRLNGIETQEETNTAMPADFLMAQMEWREAIGEAKEAAEIAELDHLSSKLRKEMHQLEAQLTRQIDADHAYTQAAETVRKMRFFEKLKEDIHSALEALES
jgi:molecular chaperone HscB